MRAGKTLRPGYYSVVPNTPLAGGTARLLPSSMGSSKLLNDCNLVQAAAQVAKFIKIRSSRPLCAHLGLSPFLVDSH